MDKRVLLPVDSIWKGIVICWLKGFGYAGSKVNIFCGFDSLSIDDSIKLLKNKTAIQGSFNPSILKEDNSIIYEEVKTMIEKFRGYPGYIFNLGHGITPDINPDKVKFLTDSVRGL